MSIKSFTFVFAARAHGAALCFRLAVVTLPPAVPATHLPVFLSVVTSTLIAALLLTVSGVMISECPKLGACVGGNFHSALP